MTSVGIVGTGVAGLHLALMLQQHGVPVVLYTDRTPAEVASGRLLNTIMHHHHTREREMELGVAHWPISEIGWWTRYHAVLEPAVSYRGNFEQPSSALDYRIYLPRLEHDFVERGGEVRVGRLDRAGLEAVSERHDLLAIATGRGPLAEMFGRREDLSPYTSPQRILLAALFTGIDRPTPEGVSISAARGVGELVEFPIVTTEGKLTGLLFENLPGAELENLARTKYDDDPAAFDKLVLRALETYYPRVFDRVRSDDFGMLGPSHILQGGVIPVVRNDYVRLDSGRFALAIGDCHTAVDPLMGQGANAASFSAHVAGKTIIEDIALDELFCQRVAAERAEVVLGASRVTNMYMEFPDHLRTLQAACVRDQRVADAVAAAFARPEQMWRIMSSPERVGAFVDQFA